MFLLTACVPDADDPDYVPASNSSLSVLLSEMKMTCLFINDDKHVKRQLWVEVVEKQIYADGRTHALRRSLQRWRRVGGEHT